MSIRLRSILAFTGLVVVFVAGGLLTQSEIFSSSEIEFFLFLIMVPLFLLGIAAPASRSMLKSTKWLENERNLQIWQDSHGPFMGKFREWFLGIDKAGHLRE
ncbi:hypothetical protein SAMN05444003_2796 [Cognatiyoonia sediminum]|uniref:Uncharacterized protein n=1 Tax=Cognatiyoonia sediminum TaxID=1508389 RepID=A0A1M5S0R4_9RHOB|nr:hypothetical protein SAMN05444003_2796 [Cognatiyoonia sediminum]